MGAGLRIFGHKLLYWLGIYSLYLMGGFAALSNRDGDLWLARGLAIVAAIPIYLVARRMYYSRPGIR